MNCSQIFCIFAVETTLVSTSYDLSSCELLSNFLYFCSRNNVLSLILLEISCELLSNFLYFCSRNNCVCIACRHVIVVNCSQIFCIFAVETTYIYTRGEPFRCELLSNFLYFCSRNNSLRSLLCA